MKKILVIFSVLVIIALAFGAYMYNGFYGGNVNVKEGDKAYIYIRTNANYQEVLDTLRPFLKNESSFDQLAQIKKYPNLIKPGKYEIKDAWSNNDLINHLRIGKQVEVKVIFNNASSVQELAGKIARQIEADSSSIVNYVLNDDFLKQQKFTEATLPALFVPNTYRFFWNTDAEKFAERMLKEYKKFWNKSRIEQAKNIGLTPNEVSTLASIVQKETVKTEERKTVAGLYMNRLKNNWKLESDPTVIYALRKQEGFKTIIKRVLYEDLKIDSPYNTYKYRGLPPGPITIPEISAIESVLSHKKHAYFFMCASADNLGYHEFAVTLRQHNINAKKYQNWLNKQNIRR